MESSGSGADLSESQSPPTLSQEEMTAPLEIQNHYQSIFDKTGLPYAAFTVLTEAERQRLFALSLTESSRASVKSAIEEAVAADVRKIVVKRPRWEKKILEILPEVVPEADNADSGEAMGVVIGTVVYSTQKSTSLLDDIDETPIGPSLQSYSQPLLPSPQKPIVTTAGLYVGVENQGNTCYLSSVIQVLYHIPYFRNMIYRLDERCKDPIPVALRNLFAQMECRATGITTKELTDAFGWTTEEAARQHDVHELVQVLFDSLEQILQHTVDSQAIKKLFYGTLTYYTKCLDVDYTSRRSEGLYDVELTVKGNASLQESFEACTRAEAVDGKYCWDHDDGTKSYHPCERGVVFDKLPPVLMIHPSRVDFDMQRMERTTVGTHWSFPLEIDLAPFLSMHTPPPAPPTEDETARQQSFHTLTTHSYTLKSIIIHQGSPTVGHYYALVRMADDEWISFNDERVRTITESEAMRLAFGGMTTSSYGYSIPSSNRASLLTYINTEVFEEISRVKAMPDSLGELMSQLEKEKKAREEAALLEKNKITAEYVVLDDDGDYLLFLEEGKKPDQTLVKIHTVTMIRGCPKEELNAIPEEVIAAQLNLTAADIRLWSYQWLPLYVTDRVSRGFGTNHALKFVEVLKKGRPQMPSQQPQEPPTAAPDDEDGSTQASDMPPLLPVTVPLPELFHLRAWTPTGAGSSTGYLKYIGISNSINQLTAIISSLPVPPEFTVPDAPAKEDGTPKDGETVVVEEAPPLWSTYCVIGKKVNPLYNVQSAVSGSNIVIAPSYISHYDLPALLSRKAEMEVDIARVGHNGTHPDLFRINIDVKANMEQMQQMIFSKMEEMGFEVPPSHQYIGIHEHDTDLNGPKSGLVHTTQFPHTNYYSSPTTVQTLFKVGGYGVTVHKLYVQALPFPIGVFDDRPFISLRVQVTAEYCRSVFIDCDAKDVDVVKSAAMTQLVSDPQCPLLPWGDTPNFRIIFLDYWGKIKNSITSNSTPFYNIFSRYDTPILDALQPAPDPPSGEPDLVPTLVDVQHVNRYSGENYFGTPTNTHIFFDSEYETGDVIMSRILKHLHVHDAAASETCHTTWKIILKGSLSSKALPRTEVFRTVFADIGTLLYIMLDHLPQNAVKPATREHALQIHRSTSLSTVLPQ